MAKDQNTETRILESAKRVFQQKGMGGARMQEIADEAGINKALLHYYFRSKDKLFEAVFLDTLQQLGPQIQELLMADLPLFEKIDQFIERYIDLLLERPYLPSFVLYELNRDPDHLIQLITSTGVSPKPILLFNQIQQEIEEGNIKAIQPMDLVLNIISMCIFPFAAAPMVKGLFKIDHDTFKMVLQYRKKTIKEFVHNALRP